ncbi:hypothetical protein DL93DRAFT_2167783 [Clavulina sp. PMI_390]|nr:hypothetical protein DL93DRAFT_2167783 [Clavulina sp. PMI_390]
MPVVQSAQRQFAGAQNQPESASVLTVFAEPHRGYPRMKVYYRIIEDRLALVSRQSFDERDPTIGRVNSNRFEPPTVESFKHALSRLEGIALSRIISFQFSSQGQDQPPSTQLSTLDGAAPGVSPMRPFVIYVTPSIDGAAEIALSEGEPGKAASSLRPEGWSICCPKVWADDEWCADRKCIKSVPKSRILKLTLDIRLAYIRSDEMHLRIPPKKRALYQATDFFFANGRRPQVWLVDGSPRRSAFAWQIVTFALFPHAYSSTNSQVPSNNDPI